MLHRRLVTALAVERRRRDLEEQAERAHWYRPPTTPQREGGRNAGARMSFIARPAGAPLGVVGPSAGRQP
jgi:hypothetical protein